MAGRLVLVVATSVALLLVSHRQIARVHIRGGGAGGVARGPSEAQLAYAVRRYRNLTFDTNQTAPLPVDWEPPAGAETFCFAWTQNTDDWWTHHPTFRVASENDTHFCFGPRPARAAAIFRALYDVQFRGDCRRVATRRMWSDGWGADVRNVLDGLAHAHRSRRPFQVDRTPWHYAAGQDVTRPVCPGMGLDCYFLPLSGCAPDPAVVAERAPYSHGVPQFFASRYYYRYLTRPRQWLRMRIYDYVRSLPLARPCSVAHVRRGDSALGGAGTSRRAYRAIQEYLAPLRNDPRNILLLTDDADAVAEARRLHPTYHWMYFERPRYRGAEGGWEQHLPSEDPAFEVVALLSELRLATQCVALVHSASNFGQLLYAEMKRVNSTVRRVNLG